MYIKVFGKRSIALNITNYFEISYNLIWDKVTPKSEEFFFLFCFGSIFPEINMDISDLQIK